MFSKKGHAMRGFFSFAKFGRIKDMNHKPEQTTQRFNKNSIIGFVFGLISAYFSLAIITGPLAAFFSIKGIRQIKMTNEKGKKLALIGLILGIVFFVFGVITVFSWWC